MIPLVIYRCWISMKNCLSRLLNSRQRTRLIIGFLFASAVLPACTSLNTFPTIVRPGGTVSVMVGGSELARKTTVSVMLTDANGQTWDLRSLGLVRSVFNLRADGTAHGMHYSGYSGLFTPWFQGHEPLQTVLVTDIPANVALGQAYLTISLNAADNSSGIADPFQVNLSVIKGTGASDEFFRQNPFGPREPVDFEQLERAPQVKISFAAGTVIGAASLVLSFDNAVLNGDDINVYSPESTVRGDYSSPGAFGKTQRMVYWRQDGQNLYLDVIAPQGVDGRYLQLFVVYPRGLASSPNFTLTGATVYDVNGSVIATQPNLRPY
jgi:hypothetical protein